MSEQCHHMREAVPTGACIVCAPYMFMSREKLRGIDDWFRRYHARREPLVEPQAWRSVPVEPSLPPALAPWQEMTQSEFTILYTLAVLARNPDFDGIPIDRLRRELRATWPESEVQHSLGQLRIKGYAGPYSDGLWGIAGKGQAVIDDYKNRYAEVS